MCNDQQPISDPTICHLCSVCAPLFTRGSRYDTIKRRGGEKLTVWTLELLEGIPCPTLMWYKWKTHSVGKKAVEQVPSWSRLKRDKEKVSTRLIKVSDCGSSAFINLVCSPHGQCLCWRGASPAEGGMLWGRIISIASIIKRGSQIC